VPVTEKSARNRRPPLLRGFLRASDGEIRAVLPSASREDDFIDAPELRLDLDRFASDLQHRLLGVERDTSGN
jgi:hypothetical protein